MREKLRLPLTVLGGVIACLLALAFIQKAFAADLGGAPKKAAAAVNLESSWTGCGPGVHGGWLQGSTVAGGPIDIGSQGSTLGVSADCLFRFGTSNWLAGGGVEYDRIFGDIHKIGVDSNLGLYGRFGYLVTPSAMAYARLGWSRVEGSFGNTDGYQYGGGLELKLQTEQPLFLDVGYLHGRYNNVAGAGFDAESNTVRVGLTYRFGAMPRN